MPKRPNNVSLTADGRAIHLLDQSQLPLREVFLDLDRAETCYEAIRALRIRGAPAIGIFAGYALFVLGQQIQAEDPQTFLAELERLADYLNSARPTAVNLSWALKRQMQVARQHQAEGIPAILAALKAEAIAIQDEDIAMCQAIAEHGLSLLKPGDGLLTHCNAGPLATSLYGTALGPMLLGQEQGYAFHVFADETRPLLQGARLTSYELQAAGVDVTLICDNMASIVMKSGQIQACLVGCDRVAANGDAANKIGTSGVAILAKHYGIPFYVLGPTSTIDLDCPTGADIEIEERPGEEISTLWYEKPMAPQGVKTYNPAFDVTDHELISAIITEAGVCRAPYDVSLREAVLAAEQRRQK